ncbi:MAG: biotin/lipoate A/B protein ligase family protein [Candidatus Bathyarchaeia archaeon]
MGSLNGPRIPFGIWRWRLLDLESEDPAMNMALEEAIARAVGRGVSVSTVRFWRNEGAVVIGRFQSARLEVDLDACKRYGIEVIRRFTGGGAVYQDLGNLNFAISIPSHNLPKAGWLPALPLLSSPVVSALRSLGLDAELCGMRIRIGGRAKVSGLAGCLRWGCGFLHGTLLVDCDLSRMRELLIAPQGASNYVRSIPDEVANLSDFRDGIDMGILKRALLRSFEEAFGGPPTSSELDGFEAELADSLYEGKYSNDEWNLNP